jgi:uncharacterized protein YndB with AHSA1/START domain
MERIMAYQMLPVESRPKRDVVITRIVSAPPVVVFKMWTDPKHLAQWFGPRRFTIPACEIDARPGGNLRIVMRGPDGNEYPMKGVFQQVVPPRLLTFTNIAVDAQGNHLLEGFTKVTFEDLSGKTRMTLETSATGLVDFAPQMLQGMEAGWTQSFEKLDEHVAFT